MTYFFFGLGLCVLALILYAAWIEPAWRLRVVRYALKPKGWRGAPLRIVILSDIHAGWPHVSLTRLQHIARKANALNPDLAVHLGDYGAAHRFCKRYPKSFVVNALKDFTSLLGTWAVLGNHDWWQDPEALKARSTPEAAFALAEHNIPLLNNEAVRLREGADAFWLVGLADQRPDHLDPDVPGFDDLEGALSQITDDAPAILLAHEPEIFAETPAQVCVTLSGHTHGGQVRIGHWSPAIYFSDTEEFGYGQYDMDGRHLVVSGGIGCSNVPIRFNMPPEITVVDIG